MMETNKVDSVTREMHTQWARAQFYKYLCCTTAILALACMVIAFAMLNFAANSAAKQVNAEWVRATSLLFDSLTYVPEHEGQGSAYVSVERSPRQLQKLVQDKANMLREEKGIRGPAILSFDLQEIEYNWKPSRGR